MLLLDFLGESIKPYCVKIHSNSDRSCSDELYAGAPYRNYKMTQYYSLTPSVLNAEQGHNTQHKIQTKYAATVV